MSKKLKLKVTNETLLLHIINELSKEINNVYIGETVISLANMLKSRKTSSKILKKLNELIIKAKIKALEKNDETAFKRLLNLEKEIKILSKKAMI